MHFYGYTGFNESHATEKAAQTPSATLPVPAAGRRAAPIASAGSLEAPIASQEAQLWHRSQRHLAHAAYIYGAI